MHVPGGSDLERGSLAAQVDGFRAYTVAHPIIKDVDAELKRAIIEPAGRSLVFVVGPTGVGKTTLVTRIARYFEENDEPQNGHSPLIVLEAPAPDSTTFSWRDFYERALYVLGGAPQGKKSKRSPNFIQHPYSIAQMRRRFEYAVREHRPRAVLIDEAQHLIKVSSGRKLVDQMDSLKSLASFTGCVYVLIGTYELLPSRNLSAQLSRRSVDIHFRRYSARSAEDVASFQRVLFSFERALPVTMEPQLAGDWQYYFERCLGCVGILKDWLTKALVQALSEGAPTLNRSHVDRLAWSPDQLEKMAQETLYGESVFDPDDESRIRLRRMLGLESAGPLRTEPSATEPHKPVATLPRKTGTPIERRPARDRIGKQAR